MRLQYFGETEDKARIAVLEWAETENTQAQIMISRLSPDWQITACLAAAYITIKDRSQFKELMQQYQQIKKQF